MSQTTQQKSNRQLLVLTDFIDNTPNRVIIDPEKVVAAVAYGKGANSGVEFLFDNGSTLAVSVWDTHLIYVLDQMCGYELTTFDRRVEQEKLDAYLLEEFGIEPPARERPTQREQTSRFGSRKQQRREREAESADHGRGRPCSGCGDEYEAEALKRYIDEDDELHMLCDECFEELGLEAESEEQLDLDTVAKAAVQADDDE